MNVQTGSALLIKDLAGPSPESVLTSLEPAERTCTIVDRPRHDDCRWQARITTGDDDHPGTVIDSARFDTLAKARRWTTATSLYWQAYAPDGWWVTGSITTRAGRD